LPPGPWRIKTTGAAAIVVEVLSLATTAVTLALNAHANSTPSPAPYPEDTHTGSITGHVIFADNDMPIPYASVMVLSGAGPAPDIAPLTNTAGRFVLDGLRPGEWTVRVITAQGLRTDARVRVAPGQRAELVVRIGTTAGPQF
jgi:Carboxypeptidase regulatory-like domain